MPRFEEGDRVRIDIPDESDPDHPKYHGEHGTVTSILRDDAGAVTQDDRDGYIYRVEFDTGQMSDFRRRDLRPPL